jgi:hypothetical protein
MSDFVAEGMQFSDFRLGMEFLTKGRDGPSRWRVTDLGSRTVIAIRVEPVEIATHDANTGETTPRTLTKAEAEADGWFVGPPYAVAEMVFDEEDIEGCWVTT